MIDASKFPSVPVVPIADLGQLPSGRIESNTTEREKTKLGAQESEQNGGLAPKQMALQDGRYYVVTVGK